MADQGQLNSTPIHVDLCEWHLRCVFWNERLWEKYEIGVLDILWGPLKERLYPSVRVLDAKYNQELTFIDAVSEDQVARCHWFLAADKITICASGLADPKHITWRGFDYHGNGKKECAHCQAGLTTWPTGDPHE